MAKAHPANRPPAFTRGGYHVRFAASAEDLHRAQALRHLCFVTGAGRAGFPDGREADRFDPACDHVLVERGADVLCTFRLATYGAGAEAERGYAAQYYNLAQLHDKPAPMVELGRFCVHPKAQGDADVLRMAWGMIAAYVDAHVAQLLFGCSSFAGTDAERFRAALDLLAARYLAPADWAIGPRAPEVVAFARDAAEVADHRAALAQIPPLLRTYLTMGGWVSDHAVVDRKMNTLHVFTGLEIARIPAARAQALRKVASGG